MSIDIKKIIDESSIKDILATKLSEIFKVDKQSIIEQLENETNKNISETGMRFHKGYKEELDKQKNISPENFSGEDINIIKDE